MDGNIYLISLVKRRPVLWNKSCQKIRDLEARNAAWKEIASIIGIETDWIRTRWYNLRERFVKELKLSHNGKRSRFKYYGEMYFLSKQIEFRRRIDFGFDAFIEHKSRIPVNVEFEFTEAMIDTPEPLEEESIFRELSSFKVCSFPTQAEKNEISAELIKSDTEFSSHKEIRADSMNTAENEQTRADNDCTFCDRRENEDKLLNKDANTLETRCEDAIFGELVTAILRKMSENKKKNAKKEIIGILLA